MDKTDIDVSSLDYSKPVSYYVKLFDVPLTTLKRWLISLGVYNRFAYTSGENTAILRGRQMRAEYAINPKRCARCDDPLSFDQKRYTYCSHACSATDSYDRDPERRARQSIEIRQRMKDGTWSKPTPPIIKGPQVERTTLECQHCKQEMIVTPSGKHRKYCSRECASKNPILGGYREKAGAPRSGWYGGVYCNSSWELAWVIYHLDHNIPFIRCSESFPYQYGGKQHMYHPDFVLSDGTYVEIKGRDNAKWQAKITQFDRPIKVYYARDLKEVFTYVHRMYGADYIRLYEGNPHKQRQHQCKGCGKPCRKHFCSRQCSGRHVSSLRGWNKQSTPSGEPSISEPSQGSVPGEAPG